MKKLLTLFTLLLCVCSGAWGAPTSTHSPGVYEKSTELGGYGQTLTTVSSRNYELYGFSSTGSSANYIWAGTTTTNSSAANCVLSFATTTEQTNGWISNYVNGRGSSYSNLSASGTEFNGMGTSGAYQMNYRSNSKLTIKISGYDQFSIFAKDANTSDKHFTVVIDGEGQDMSYSTSETVRRFDISTGEHVIEVSATGTSNNVLWGFSLRLPLKTYKVTYKANNGTEEADVVENVVTVGECPNTFSAPSGKIFAGWNTEADGSGDDYAVGNEVETDLTLYAQWIEGTATTITYNLKTNSSSTTLDNCTSATPNSGSIIASADINTYGTADCDGSNSAKDNETQKLKIDEEYTAENYYEWTFTEDNCTFAPTSVQIKFQSVNGLVQYKVALTDGITTKTTNFVQTTSVGNTLETLDWKITDGTVFAANQTIKLQLWAYKKESKATAFRLGPAITISGNVFKVDNVTIAANKEWITYCSTNALDFSKEIEGLEGAYTISSHTSGATTLTATPMTGAVKSGTGLLLHAKTVDPTNPQVISIPVVASGDEQTGNMLKGVIVDTEITPTEDIYTNLGLKNGTFVPYSATGTIAANKAYLQIPTSDMPAAGAKLTIVFGEKPSSETDGIKAVSTTVENGVRYNLAGQKVGADYKGIIIVNGKKVIIK